MGYSEELKAILEEELAILVKMIQKVEGPFNNEIVMEWYKKYIDGGKRWIKRIFWKFIIKCV